MTRETNKIINSDKCQPLKSIIKIAEGQNMYIDLFAFQDDMDEEKIELEWGRSTGATILPESNCKYDIVEKIDIANKELLSNEQQSPQHNTSDDESNPSSVNSSQGSSRKLVHFSEVIHTSHLIYPGGDMDEHEEEVTAGYWSADDISATPDEDIEESEECDTSIITNYNPQVVINCQSPDSGDYWYDSEDGSSVDLSALTDSVDRLDLSPLNTDSPTDIMRPVSPLKKVTPWISREQNMNSPTKKQSNGYKERIWAKSESNKMSDAEINYWISQENKIKDHRGEVKINKWNITENLNKWNEEQDKIMFSNRLDVKINEWNAQKMQAKKKSHADHNCEVNNKVQRRECLSRQDQSKLPKYNGLRSEYGLSQQQLNERKRSKAERKKQRYQRRINRLQEAEERKRANDIVFNNWLDKKRQQEIESKTKKCNNKWYPYQKNLVTPQQRVVSAQTAGHRRNQMDSSKLGLLRRIMSASNHSPKEQMMYSIYLGLPMQQSAFKPF